MTPARQSIYKSAHAAFEDIKQGINDGWFWFGNDLIKLRMIGKINFEMIYVIHFDPETKKEMLRN